MKKLLTKFRQMNLFEIILFKLAIFSVGVLLGNSLSPVLTNSLYIFLIFAVIGSAYFVSYFFINDSPKQISVSKATKKPLNKKSH